MSKKITLGAPIPDAASINQSENYRFVSDTEKTIWNNKQPPLVAGVNIKTIGGVSPLGPGNIPVGDGSGGGGGEPGSYPELSFYTGNNITGDGSEASPLDVKVGADRKLISATDYTLQAEDKRYTLEFTSDSPVILRLPDFLTSGALPNGQFHDFIVEVIQGGNGVITLTPDNGVLLVNRLNYNKSAGRYAPFFVRSYGVNRYLAGGDLA